MIRNIGLQAHYRFEVYPEKGVVMLLRLNVLDEGTKGRIAHILSMAAARVDAPFVELKFGFSARYFTDHQLERYEKAILAVLEEEKPEKVDPALLRVKVELGRCDKLLVFQEMNDLMLVSEKHQEFGWYYNLYEGLSEADEITESWRKIICNNLKEQNRPAEPAQAS